MPQVEFSQRAYAYGAMPCLAAALLLAHLEVLRAMPGGQAPRRTFYRAVALYTAVASLALCIHPSFALMPLASLALLGLRAWRDFPRWTAGERRSVFRSAAVAGAVLFCAALANAKNPKYGYRPYLARYYHSPLTPHSIVKLLQHAYDLAAYHLNLFYNTSLYWPERANAVLLPLIVFCALGWVLAMRGRFGAGARHLAWLGVAAIALPAVISLIGNFPFGGVRQTLFLSPFLLIFTALGLYSLRARLATRILAVALACGYAGLWGANLPRFYEERLAPYSGDDIVQAWRQNGEAPVYARGCEREVRYNIRAHPEIGIHTLPTTAQPPYLLVSTHYRIDDKVCFPGYLDYLHQAGYKVSVVTERLPKHPESLQYSGSLYFPPNGLWIYKITNQ
jgi:hypothetical protein